MFNSNIGKMLRREIEKKKYSIDEPQKPAIRRTTRSYHMFSFCQRKVSNSRVYIAKRAVAKRASRRASFQSFLLLQVRRCATPWHFQRLYRCSTANLRQPHAVLYATRPSLRNHVVGKCRARSTFHPAPYTFIIMGLITASSILFKPRMRRWFWFPFESTAPSQSARFVSTRA